MNSTKGKIFFILFFLFIFTSVVYAQVPNQLPYQGVLTNTSDTPLNGTFNLTFRIYSTSTGGSPLWSETQPSINVANGLFNVLLGNVTTLNLDFSQTYWLSIQVNSDGEMSPRQQLASVPYARRAQQVENENWTANGNNIFNTNTGNVGIGTSSPQRKLELWTDSGASIDNRIRFKRDNPGPNVNYGAIEWADNSGTNWRIGSGLSMQGMEFTEGDSAANTRMVIAVGGNVGIGTMAPTYKLHITGVGTGTGLSVENGGNFWRFAGLSSGIATLLGYEGVVSMGNAFNGPFNLRTNNIDRVTIAADGNVGIGTSSPQYKLDVEGYVQATGYYTGDIIFQKDEKPLWRMYEDENGLYLESLSTHKRFRMVMEPVGN